MKQGQDRTKFDLGKISCSLEILPCPPPPSSLESQAGCCQLPWELQETMASTENEWSRLWLWQTLFPSFSSFGDSVKSKPSVSELYKISVFLFLTSLSVAKVAHPGVAKINFCLHRWQEYFGFSWLCCLELAFHTGMSQVLALLFKDFPSKVASIQSWLSGLLDCTD